MSKAARWQPIPSKRPAEKITVANKHEADSEGNKYPRPLYLGRDATPQEIERAISIGMFLRDVRYCQSHPNSFIKYNADEKIAYCNTGSGKGVILKHL